MDRRDEFIKGLRNPQVQMLSKHTKIVIQEPIERLNKMKMEFNSEEVNIISEKEKKEVIKYIDQVIIAINENRTGQIIKFLQSVQKGETTIAAALELVIEIARDAETRVNESFIEMSNVLYKGREF